MSWIPPDRPSQKSVSNKVCSCKKSIKSLKLHLQIYKRRILKRNKEALDSAKIHRWQPRAVETTYYLNQDAIQRCSLLTLTWSRPMGRMRSEIWSTIAVERILIHQCRSISNGWTSRGMITVNSRRWWVQAATSAESKIKEGVLKAS